jgi:hypothetical protein
MSAGAGASSTRRQPLFSLSTTVRPPPRSRHNWLPERPAPMRSSCMTGTTAWDPRSATAARTPSARAKTPPPDRRAGNAAAAGQARARQQRRWPTASGRQPRPAARWSAASRKSSARTRRGLRFFVDEADYRHRKLNPVWLPCLRHDRPPPRRIAIPTAGLTHSERDTPGAPRHLLARAARRSRQHRGGGAPCPACQAVSFRLRSRISACIWVSASGVR